MSKRILSLLLCFAMVVTSLIVVPVTAVTYLNTQLKVLPDVTTALPGDTINYTIIMGPVSDLGSMQMCLDIPEGLTLVEGSGRLADGLKETMGFDVIDWTEVPSRMINGGALYDYNSDTPTTLGYFQCTVDEGFYGTTAVGLNRLEFYSCETWIDHTERYSVFTVPVDIELPAGVFLPATEVWFAGAEVNAEKPYVMQPMKSSPDTQATEDPCIASASPIPEAGQKFLATFDAETGTLTFNSGYELIEKDGTVEPEGDWNSFSTMQLMPGTNTKYGIKANGNLTIDLNGYTNGFWLDWNNHIKDVNSYGIYVEGDLTIKGDGYLRVTASAPQDVGNNYADSYTAYGVYAAGDVNFDGGMVYFFERPYVDPVAGDTATFVHAEGDITLNGGDVKMRGMKRSTWLTKFNKEPIYDSNYYYLPNVSDIEIEHAELQTLGFTRYVAGGSYNNTNNASYLIKRFDLNFETYGGSVFDPITKKIGEVVDLTEYVPIKDGLVFRGWYLDEAFTAPVSEVTLEEDTMVYAKYETPTESYTLTFDVDGGYEMDPVEELDGRTIDFSGIFPTKTGYEFEGWFSNPEFTERVSSIVITADTTVYAKWAKIFGTFEKVDEAPAPVPGTSPATEMWYANAKLTNDVPYLYGTSAGNTEMYVMSSASEVAPDGYSLLATFKDGVFTYVRGFNSSLGWNTYTSFVEVPELSHEKIYGIYANGDLVINMGTFNHFFYSNTMAGYELPMEGIHVEGNLTINGDATMRPTFKFSVNPAMGGSYKQSYGIWAKGNVYLNETIIYMYSALMDANGKSIKENYLSFIKAEKTFLNYGDIILRGRPFSTSPGTKRYETDFLVLQEGYNWDNCKKINIIEPRALGDAFETITSATWINESNLDFKAPIKKQVLFGTTILNAETPYAIPNTENPSLSIYKASAESAGAVAEYDAENNILTIKESITIDGQKSIYRIDKAIEPKVPWDIYPYTAIEARHDLNIVIPKYVDVILTSRPFGDNSVSRPIYSPGNITISGGGTLQIYSNSAWGFMTPDPNAPEDDPDTPDVDESAKRIWHYASSPIWAHGKLTISGITANLITNFDEPDGKSGHAIYGGGGIDVKDYASVYASTKLGKLLNVKPEFYEGATVMVAENGESGAGLPAATSALIPYDPEKVLDMKYIQITPTPLKIESISNVDENGLIKVTDPKITFNFNVLLDENITSDNLFVNGNPVALENFTVSGKTITIDLISVTPDSTYKIEFKKIKNEPGILFSEVVEIKTSSGFDIGEITLNGNTEGTVEANDNNTVTVQIDKATQVTVAPEVLVIATTYYKVEIDGEQVKVRRDVASKKQNITESTVVSVEGLITQAGDIIEVFIWNNQNDIRPVKKTVVFGN